MNNKPTLQELLILYEIAKELNTHESDNDLERIRDRKYTWIGKEENELRFKLDALLTKRECTICYGTGKVSDGYENWLCRACDGTGIN